MIERSPHESDSVLQALALAVAPAVPSCTLQRTAFAVPSSVFGLRRRHFCTQRRTAPPTRPLARSPAYARPPAHEIPEIPNLRPWPLHLRKQRGQAHALLLRPSPAPQAHALLLRPSHAPQAQPCSSGPAMLLRPMPCSSSGHAVRHVSHAGGRDPCFVSHVGESVIRASRRSRHRRGGATLQR